MLLRYVALMNETIIDIGPELVKHSRSIDQAAKFGPITQLFPFIYEASQTMGVREISRWLAEKKKISISPSTISRALRFSEPQWEGFSSIIEPHMRNVREFIPRDMKKFMLEAESKELDEIESTSHFAIQDQGFTGEVAQDCNSSISFLASTWFTLSPSTRLKCFPYLFDEDDESEGDEP